MLDPMPSVGLRCYELRVHDANRSWRIVYRLDGDAIVIADVFAKTTRATPKRVTAECQRRLRAYDDATNPTVSLDLLIRAHLTLGANRAEIGRALTRSQAAAV